jgi:hypothetical protein
MTYVTHYTNAQAPTRTHKLDITLGDPPEFLLWR